MKKVLCFLACLTCFSSSSFANENPQALQDAFMAALKANDVQGLAACYTSDAVNFPVGALVGSGPESVMESWSSFFSAYKILDASLSNTHLEIHGDTAVAWGLFTIMAEPTEGGEVVKMNGRYMDVARNMDGTWLYVADHASMPLPAPED